MRTTLAVHLDRSTWRALRRFIFNSTASSRILSPKNKGIAKRWKDGRQLGWADQTASLIAQRRMLRTVLVSARAGLANTTLDGILRELVR